MPPYGLRSSVEARLANVEMSAACASMWSCDYMQPFELLHWQVMLVINSSQSVSPVVFGEHGSSLFACGGQHCFGPAIPAIFALDCTVLDAVVSPPLSSSGRQEIHGC
mmetsp:Transcript_108975/g.293070  ORF Transcript_108975/g.293070 Transcript_108975/m.293070 type:complete len:108 (+) Transcript_108975:657-980(+)